MRQTGAVISGRSAYSSWSQWNVSSEFLISAPDRAANRSARSNIGVATSAKPYSSAVREKAASK